MWCWEFIAGKIFIVVVLQFSGLWVTIFLWYGCWVACVKIIFWVPPFLHTDLVQGHCSWSQVCSHRRTKDTRMFMGGYHPPTPTQGSAWAGLPRIAHSLLGVLGHSLFICLHNSVLHIPLTHPVSCLAVPRLPQQSEICCLEDLVCWFILKCGLGPCCLVLIVAHEVDAQ